MKSQYIYPPICMYTCICLKHVGIHKNANCLLLKWDMSSVAEWNGGQAIYSLYTLLDLLNFIPYS